MSRRAVSGLHPWCCRGASALLAVLAAFLPSTVAAQATGTVTGTVTRAEGGGPLAGVSVSVRSTGQTGVTRGDGRYTLRNVPAGSQVVVFRWLGYRPVEQPVTVEPGGTATLDAALEPAPAILSDLVVQGASRAPERIVEAPAAISVVEPRLLESNTITGQVPMALKETPGVDLVQSGVNDFNVNTRGFNSSLNRRMLVLQDGRDLAIAFLGSQEWNTLSVPLEELGRIEVVRGPGSALYGANAFSGVIALTTPTAREIVGTKLTIGGGELETLRGDLSHAGVAGRFGYRVNGGYYRSDTFTRSRTLLDGSSLATEYAEATDETVGPAREARPLSGQTLDPATRAPLGERDDLQNIYGSARLDYYLPGGSVVSADGGAARVENEVLVTGIGRVQIEKAIRPWARLAWAGERFNVFGFWNARRTLDPQFSLASSAPLLETSDIFHVEGQTNFRFLADRGRVVVGTSYRNTNVDTELTLMEAVNDNRSDDLYSGYGQVEFDIIPQVKLVAAARLDDGTLINTQFSPKGAIVFSPNENHSIRATVNQAFQTPNYSEFFLRVAAGAPANFTALETGLRASPLGPALAGVPVGTLFTTSAAVPVFARGNAALDVESTTGYELGYKGTFANRVYLTADVYYNKISDFVTDLLPGVNPAYGPWTAPEAVPVPFRAPLEGAVRNSLIGAGQTLAAAGLTRVNGNTEIVLSYTNAGEVEQYGAEVGVGVQITDEVRADGSLSLFDFEVQAGSQAVGDQLLANTPTKKGTLGVSYTGRQGLDLGASVRLVDSYDWAAGVFIGQVPSSQSVDVNAGYRFNHNFRVFALATNVFDQERYHLFGGSVIGRRVLGGVTVQF
jgi:outer membrane receptor for ferrienterochelin and colicins